jgi:hypothetical protein
MSSEYSEMRQKAKEINEKLASYQNSSRQVREKTTSMFDAIISARTGLETKNSTMVEAIKGFESIKSNQPIESIMPETIAKSRVKRKIIL